MQTKRRMLAVIAVCGLSVAETSRATGLAAQESLAFDQAQIRLEYNAVEDVTEVVVTASTTESLQSLRVVGPGGVLCRLHGTSGGRFGPGEIRIQSTAAPLWQQFDACPEGQYLVAGSTIDGDPIRSVVELSYELPPTPVILEPAQGQTDVALDGLVVRWLPVRGIERIEVVVERNEEGEEEPPEEEGEIIRVKIPRRSSSFTLPGGLLEPNTDYTLEVTAIGPGGNRTLVDVEITTAHR